MKKKLLFLSFLICAFFVSNVYAQKRTITGKVTSSEDGSTLPGVNVVIKGTANGTVTDIDGNYQLLVSNDAKVLVFSFIGLESYEVIIGAQSIIDANMDPDTKQLSEVVVTALGISREKRSLGYAVQELSGEDLNKVQTDNFVNSLSGKATGVQIKRTTNFGGSTNVIIRGSTSLNGDNQALFVIDGVPVANRNTNSRAQEQAGTGYDYGNSVSDINPEDIESINVLKGAAASALYGARAANGVVMITTKKGNKADKGIGVTLSSSVTVGSIIKSTFPKYQTNYGAGYSPSIYKTRSGGNITVGDGNGNGDETDIFVDFGADASHGDQFDGSLRYTWESIDPDMPGYQKARPYEYAKNGTITFFEVPVNLNNTVTISKAGELGSVRFSYANSEMGGLMPNSKLKKNSFSLGTQVNITPKFNMTAFVNYVNTDAKGRNSTGYGGNHIGMFRQWFQTNVDLKRQKDAYFSTLRNVTWNPRSTTSLKPEYFDNPYWNAYENYQSDNRNRFIGNFALTYELTDWLSVMGRIASDTYSELQEERLAVGSKAKPFGVGSGSDGSLGRTRSGSGYLRRDITSYENNYDISINLDRDLTEDLNLKALIGSNIRRTNFTRVISSTNGGLNVPGVYSLQNSIGPLPLSKELDSKIGVNGLFASASFGYKNMLFLDATIRRDKSSTLPTKDNVFIYPSVSSGFVFSSLLDVDIISFAKFRANFAQVGKGTGFDDLSDSYIINAPLNTLSSSVHQTKKNSNLKPETTNSFELGLEMEFFDDRLGFDFAYYNTNSKDQILGVSVSEATGYLYKIINAGEIQNKGIELSIYGTPVQFNDFTWNIGLNFTRNRNLVVSLEEGLENLQLGGFQGGVTINAKLKEPYGVIFGKDYTYLNPENPKSSERLIDSTGTYILSETSDKSIGNVNPNWNLGITNSLMYKNFSLSFLFDIQNGGSIFSLDQSYGLSTGLYEETDYINDLGNPVRNTLENGGGYINEGVQADGAVNRVRHQADRFGAFGYSRGLPTSEFVYDASYIKLREVSFAYVLPSNILSTIFLTGVSVGVYGSNLAILSKNLPHADPESGLGSGNLQGYSTGSLPSIREVGFNIKLTF